MRNRLLRKYEADYHFSSHSDIFSKSKKNENLFWTQIDCDLMINDTQKKEQQTSDE